MDAAAAAFAKGARVKGRYLASTLGAAVTKWYPGVVRSTTFVGALYDQETYEIAYDDGEVEEGVLPRFIKRCEIPLPQEPPPQVANEHEEIGGITITASSVPTAPRGSRLAIKSSFPTKKSVATAMQATNGKTSAGRSPVGMAPASSSDSKQPAPPPAAAKPAPPPTVAKPAPPPPAAKPTPPPAAAKPEVPPTAAAAEPAPPAAAAKRPVGHKLVGARVKVWWEDDEKWYSGTVREYMAIDDSHLVLYDDGEQRHEELSGAELQWELLPSRAAATALAAAVAQKNGVDLNDDAASPTTKPTTATKRAAATKPTMPPPAKRPAQAPSKPPLPAKPANKLTKPAKTAASKTAAAPETSSGDDGNDDDDDDDLAGLLETAPGRLLGASGSAGGGGGGGRRTPAKPKLTTKTKSAVAAAMMSQGWRALVEEPAPLVGGKTGAASSSAARANASPHAAKAAAPSQRSPKKPNKKQRVSASASASAASISSPKSPASVSARLNALREDEEEAIAPAAPVPPPPMDHEEAMELLGKSIDVYWDGNADWFQAIVISYDKISRTHVCWYPCDGERSKEKLCDASTPWRRRPEPPQEADDDEKEATTQQQQQQQPSAAVSQEAAPQPALPEGPPSVHDLSLGVEALEVPLYVRAGGAEGAEAALPSFSYVARSLNRTMLTTEGAMLDALLERRATGGDADGDEACTDGELSRSLVSRHLQQHHMESDTLFLGRQQKAAGEWTGGGGGGGGESGEGGEGAGEGGKHVEGVEGDEGGEGGEGGGVGGGAPAGESFGCGKCRWAPKGCTRCRQEGFAPGPKEGKCGGICTSPWELQRTGAAGDGGGLHVRIAVSDDTPICRRLRQRGLHGGFGVVALEPISAGAPVVEYVGEILTREQAAAREERYAARALPCSYALYADGCSYVIDPTLMGNAARLMNASCEPNLRPTPLRLGRSADGVGLANAPRVLFVATKDIAAGEELTWTYNAAVAPALETKVVKSVYGGRRSGGATARGEETDPSTLQGHPCLCGAPTCKRLLA